MTFRVGDETFEAGAGTLVWLPRIVRQTFANLSDGPAWVFGTITPAGSKACSPNRPSTLHR